MNRDHRDGLLLAALAAASVLLWAGVIVLVRYVVIELGKVG